MRTKENNRTRMRRMQATLIRTDIKTRVNQRSEISFICVPKKKEWNADDADASNADKNGYKNPRKPVLSLSKYQRAKKRFKI